MAWTTPTVRTTGELITASIWNTDLVADLIELRSGGIAIASQAALDFIYGSSATQLARLGGGAALQGVRRNAANNAWEYVTISTPGVGLPATINATNFETRGRFNNGAAGGGTDTWGSNGLILDTTAAATSGLLTQLGDGSYENTWYSGSPTFMWKGAIDTEGTDFDIFIGLSNYSAATGAAITDTTRRIGFKYTRSASGTIILQATQADGTSETHTTMSSGSLVGAILWLCFRVNGSGSVDYYYAFSANAWSAATNQTATMPSNSGFNAPTLMISNRGVATRTVLRSHSMCTVR